MLKSANKLVKEHELTEEFPDVSYLYKERWHSCCSLQSPYTYI
jgi:hypothetical protein